MYPLLKTLAAQLIMPLPITFAFLALGGLLYWGRYRQAGAVSVGLGVAVLFLASWGPVAERLLAPLETRHAPIGSELDESLLEGEASVDAIVVLGSSWQPNAPYASTSKLNDSASMRLVEGVRLWRQAPRLPLIVTGASRRAGEASIAEGYAAAADALGVPESAIQVLDWPTDTGREASAVRERLGAGARILLVTSASHMPRAMRHFETVALTPIAAPTHYLGEYHEPNGLSYWVPSARHLRKTERAIYEALGLLMVGREHS